MLLRKKFSVWAVIAIAMVCSPFFNSVTQAQGYIFAGLGAGTENRITHSSGYDGTGGDAFVTVGIEPTSANASAMRISVENAVRTWDRLVPTSGNLETDFVNIPSGAFDFESVFLHELGHSLGLAHVNLGFQRISANGRNLTNVEQEFSNASFGNNGQFDLNAGADGVVGSSDDIRGDDVNLQYFKITDNNPFTLPASGVIDSTTYSRDLNDLPAGHNFATNASRDVAEDIFGIANTESVMQQGTFNNEIQRELAVADVIGIRYAESGLDELQGTADDYNLRVNFVEWDGVSERPDIVVDFDSSETGFAVSQSSGEFLTSDHLRISQNNIFFNTGFTWHFNTVSNVQAIPEPSGFVLLLAVGTVVISRRSRR
jgi:hypothetical protein